MATLIDAPKKEQKQFAEAFQKYDQALAAIKTYDELDKQDKLPASAQVNVDDIPPEIENTLEGTYQNIIDNSKAENKNDDDPVDVDLDEDYELESIHIKEVDERYIMALIQDYISTANNSQRQSRISQQSADLDQAVQVGDYIDKYAKTNEPRASHIRSIWQDVQNNPQKYSDQKVEDVLETSIAQENKKVLSQLADDFGLDYGNLTYVIHNYKPDEVNPKGMGDLVSKKYFDRYKKAHPDSKLKNWLSWKTEVREKVKLVYNTKIKPLESED